MQGLKTVAEWFEELPADAKVKAKMYTELNYGSATSYYMNNSADSLEDALEGAFVWGNTEEGYEYWMHRANGNN